MGKYVWNCAQGEGWRSAGQRGLDIRRPTLPQVRSQTLHLSSGGAWPGSTITEQNSPQRPHCRTSLVGSFTMGLVADAMALSAWARSSALVSAGARCRILGGGAIVADARSASSVLGVPGFSLPCSAILASF